MSACNCIGPQNGDPRCPCMMSRRKDDPKYFYEPKDDKGYFTFVSNKLANKKDGFPEDELSG